MSHASPNASLAPDADPPQLLSYQPALGLGEAFAPLEGLALALYVTGCAFDAALVAAVSCLPALRRKAMFCFMANLAVADLLRSHAGLALVLYAGPGLPGRAPAPLPLAACRAQLFFFSLSSTAGFVSVTSMLIDRYLAICHPFHYLRSLHGGRATCVALAAGWAASLLVAASSLGVSMHLRVCLPGSDGSEGGNPGPPRLPGLMCDHLALAVASCHSSSFDLASEAAFTGVLSAAFVLLSAFTYAKVMRASMTGGGSGVVTRACACRRKATHTCCTHGALHSASLALGMAVFLLEVTAFQAPQRFRHVAEEALPPALRSAAAAQTVLQVVNACGVPVVNALVYGLRSAELRAELGRALRRRRAAVGAAVPAVSANGGGLRGRPALGT